MKRQTILYRHTMMEISSPSARLNIKSPYLFSVEASYASVPTINSLSSLDSTQTKSRSNSYTDRKEVLSLHYTINELLHKFRNSEEYKELLLVQQGLKVFIEKRPHSEFFDLVEMVLHLYNVKFSLITEKVEDSALTISPIKDEEQLKRYLAVLLPEVAKFPSTMFKRFGINLFNFCETIELKKEEFREVYTKKVTNGTFFIQDHEYPHKVRTHLFKIVCYHVNQHQKDFAKQWKSLNPSGFNYIKGWEGKGKLKGFINKDATKSILDDQVEILSCLLGGNTETLNVLNKADEIIKQKVKLMTKTFVAVEPNFAYVNGWSK